LKHKVESKEIIFNEFFKIERAKVSWEQFDKSMGKFDTRYVVRRGDSVGIIPVCLKNDELILIKQFRYPSVRDNCDGYLLEIPAGMVDDGEDPMISAERELLEETGIKNANIEHLISFYLSPGALDEMFHLYLARINQCLNIKTVGGKKEENENIGIKKFKESELLEMIKSNKIRDGKTIASILFYLQFRR